MPDDYEGLTEQEAANNAAHKQKSGAAKWLPRLGGGFAGVIIVLTSAYGCTKLVRDDGDTEVSDSGTPTGGVESSATEGVEPTADERPDPTVDPSVTTDPTVSVPDSRWAGSWNSSRNSRRNDFADRE